MTTKQSDQILRPIVRTKKARNRPPAQEQRPAAPKVARGTDHEVIKPASKGAASVLSSSQMPLSVRENAEPKLLWDRANMIRHLKNAADVRVAIQSLGTTVRVVKSDLIEQFRAVSADGEFVPPDLEVTPEGLLLVFRN